MIIFADGSYYEATCTSEHHGSQEHFKFVTSGKVPYHKGIKSAVSIKYGRSVINHSLLREICGRTDEFYPRIFSNGYEKAAAFNNRF